MISSVNKFFGEQDPRHRGYLVWNSRFLFPCRIKPDTDVKRLIDKDDIRNYLYVAGDAWTAVFDLSKKKDREFFMWVKDRAANGWFSITHQEYHWDTRKRRMIVYLEWIQYYTQFKPRSELI